MVSSKTKKHQDFITKLIQAKEVFITMYGLNKQKDKVIMLKTEDINHFVFSWDGEPAFTYVWGWPGPDTNVYRFSDYGETWAFTKQELEIE